MAVRTLILRTSVQGMYSMNYRCPVCLFDRLPYSPEDYHICPCCGTEFGNDDEKYSLEELRSAWIENGTEWFYEKPPAGWDPWEQLISGGREDLVPTGLYNIPMKRNKASSILSDFPLECNKAGSILSDLPEDMSSSELFSFA
jgi:hypothetical protein